MKCIVTGSNGFLGQKLCNALKAKNHELVKYDLETLDIRSKELKLEKADVLFHLAAINKPYFSLQEPFETFKTNVFGTLNVLEAAKKSGIKKIIFTSSIFVYKNLTKTKETDQVGYNGIYPYGLEKLIDEEYIKIYSYLYGLDYAILRISGVYGPKMYKNPIYDLLQGFLKGKAKLFVNKESVYNFVYVDDVVSALLKSVKWKKETVNLCSDKNIKIINIYNFLKKRLGKDVSLEDTNFLIKIFGNNKKIKQKGWKEKYSIKEGLMETYKHLLREKNHEN